MELAYSPSRNLRSLAKIPQRVDGCKLLTTETIDMTYKYNLFAAAYPSDGGPISKIFQAVVDFRTYMRAGHMALMFPLGIAYFVLFVTTLAVGGPMI